jgi:hypothetical protein
VPGAAPAEPPLPKASIAVAYRVTGGSNQQLRIGRMDSIDVNVIQLRDSP